MKEVVKINTSDETVADRAAALMLLERLRNEQQRIQDEIDLLTNRLQVQLHDKRAAAGPERSRMSDSDAEDNMRRRAAEDAEDAEDAEQGT